MSEESSCGEDSDSKYFSDKIEDRSFLVWNLSPELLSSHSSLNEFRSLFECAICYEVIQNPVMTKCSHNFCSVCLRKYLCYKAQCPTCFKEVWDRDLLPNRSLQSIIEAFILRLLPGLQNAPLRPISPLPSTSGNVVILKSQESPIKEILKSTACPVCEVIISESKINAHLDRCLKIQKDPDIFKPIVPKESRKPLSKTVYYLLKDSDLKKKLKDEGLEVKGDRKTMVSRHQRFAVLWNAECDKERPRSRTEILRQVRLEESEEKKVAHPHFVSQYDRNSKPEIIESKQKSYLKDNKSNFDKLISNVRSQSFKKEEEITTTTTENIVIEPSIVEILEAVSDTESQLVTPKRKSLNSLSDTSKKLKQNSVKKLFESNTPDNKTPCPKCETIVSTKFLNVHLDRCLDDSPLDVQQISTRSTRRKIMK